VSQLALVARPPAEVPAEVRQAAELALERTADLDLESALTAVTQAAPGRWPELIEDRDGRRRIFWPRTQP
jgi:hypothetical protein